MPVVKIVLAAVAQDGNALQFAAVELKGDHEIVLVAVAQNGNALQFAVAELKGDHEIVLAAVVPPCPVAHHESRRVGTPPASRRHLLAGGMRKGVGGVQRLGAGRRQPVLACVRLH